MFFFFIGSYAPKLSRIISSPVRCPNCLDTTPTVYHYKVQHQLSVFFIPIWRTRAKYLWICDRCKWTGFSRPEEQVIQEREETQQRPPLQTWGLSRCPNCNMEINISERMRFCPYCGSRSY